MTKTLSIISFLFLYSSSIAQFTDTLVPVFNANVYFDSDEFSIDTAGAKELMYLTYVSTQMDSFVIKVNAHTDEIGSSAYNMKLSEKRMLEIVDLLRERNIPDSLIRRSFSGENLLAIPDNHEKNRRGEVVLYQPMRLMPITGRVVDEETKEGIPASVTVNDWIYTHQADTDDDGHFSILAPLGSRTSLTVSAPDYFMEGNLIAVHKGLLKKALTIPLPKLAMNGVYSFKNLNFEASKAILLAHSYIPVVELADFMIEKSGMCFEIQGHVNWPNADSAGIETFHFDLSVARALKIKKELADSEVDTSRLLAQGYANWRMKYPKAFSENQKAANRRVTIAIRDCNEIKEIPDHQVDDLGKYDIEYLDWKYDPSKISILFGNNTLAKLALYSGALKAVKSGVEPSNYSYRQLFKLNAR